LASLSETFPAVLETLAGLSETFPVSAETLASLPETLARAAKRPASLPKRRARLPKRPADLPKTLAGLPERPADEMHLRGGVAERRYTFPVDDPYEEDARRMAKLIGSIVRLSGRPLESMATAAGLSEETLAAIFDGAVALEVAHILRLAEAFGVHPSELFVLAFPRRVPSGDTTRKLLERARAVIRAQTEAADATPDERGSRGRSGEDPE
jgi:transcriptional regulator with XRE-family HTH domain